MDIVNINQLNILTIPEILNIGIEFTDEVCYSGRYGEQVFNKPMEEGGGAFTGLLYEKYPNGTLAYYSFYENGIPHGVTVEYYQNGNVKEYKCMVKGTISGKSISWFESGEIKSVAENKYGFKLCFQEWNKSGKLIKEKQEPTDFEKEMIAKYEQES